MLPGSRSARAVERIVSDPPHFIAAMQLGVTLTSLGIGALGEPVLSELFDVAVTDPYPASFSRWDNTHFHHLIAHRR